MWNLHKETYCIQPKLMFLYEPNELLNHKMVKRLQKCALSWCMEIRGFKTKLVEGMGKSPPKWGNI